jgi:hypothetical protein
LHSFFYRHPLVLPYRWYWRIEPDVHFHCDINFDPFLYMQDRGKVYGALGFFVDFELVWVCGAGVFFAGAESLTVRRGGAERREPGSRTEVKVKSSVRLCGVARDE